MSTFSWRPVAPLRHARAVPIAVPLVDGRVLVAQGTGMLFAPKIEVRVVAAVEVWDPGTDRWEAADDLVDAKGALVGVKGQVWDGALQRWTEIAQLPAAATPGAITLPDGTRLSAGGAERKGGEPYGKRETAHANVHFDPPRGRPVPSPLKQARIKPALTLLADGRVLVTGGYQALMDYSWETIHRSVGQAELIDPKSGEVTDGGDLAHPRHEHTAVLLPDGSVLLIGGHYDENQEMAQVELGRAV